MQIPSRSLAMLLASLFLLSACGQNPVQEETSAETNHMEQATDQSAETSEAEEKETFKDDVPELNFDGETFTFLTKPHNNDGYWGHIEFYAEELNAVPVNDAVFNRNKLIEERFGITIEEYRSGNYLNDFRNTIAAQEDAYDCVPFTIQHAAEEANNGNLLEFTELSYIDLDKPWWDPVLNDIFTVGHKQYFAVGDITLVDKEATYMIMFNKSVQEQHQLEDFYDMVREGSWTMDKMMDFCEKVTNDVDGNGKFTFNDKVGLVTDAGATFRAMFYAGEGKFFSKNADDMPEYSLDMDRATRIVEKIFRLRAMDAVMLEKTLQDQGVVNAWSDEGLNGMFKEDRALFYAISLTVMSRMRDMESDFGVIPYPKLDENDAEYTSYIAGELGDCIAIPVTASDPVRTSAILEAMCCESGNIIMPAYYDVTVTTKTARDEESKEMLDYVFDHRTLDITQLFDWGGMHSKLSTLASADVFASTMKKAEKSAIRAMEKTYEKLGEND